jgi:hypothetical protein
VLPHPNPPAPEPDPALVAEAAQHAAKVEAGRLLQFPLKGIKVARDAAKGEK